MLVIGFATHNTLTELMPNGDLVGELAESWESSPDARVWTFKLRQGVEFHNGKTLAAEDVIASLEYHRNEASKSAAKGIFDTVSAIEADGPDTVVVSLNAGNADLPFQLIDYHLLIFPAVDGTVDWRDYQGTGGYTLAEFEPGVRALMKRNPNYWKSGRAHVDEVELLAINDINARQNALTTGEVHAINRPDLKTLSLLARRSGIRIVESTGYLHYTAPMLTNVAPFDNNDVRLALKYAIDREAMLQSILKGHGVVANDHPIAPSLRFHADALEQRQYDPDKARFHLKQAGLDKLSVNLSAADAAYVGAVDAAVLYREHAAAAGIDINVVREPSDGYWSSVWMTEPFCQAYWGGRPTADWMFSQAYASDANWNDSAWKHERFNQLLVQARAELDETKRADMYTEMQQLVRDEGGVVIWAFANYVYGLSDAVSYEGEMAGNWELDGGRAFERWWMS
jgi:peptide/nickel transport system substrate-binding protein